MNKKGSLLDILLIPVILVVIGLSIFFATFLHQELKTTGLYEHSNETKEIRSSITQTVDLFPYMFIMVLISIFITLLISAYFIPSSPIFLVAGIIIIFVGTILAAQMSNAWGVVYQDSAFISIKSNLEPINLFMEILPLITFVGGALFLMVLYGKHESRYT
jgi:choline-glycine betaine transporter